MLVLAALLQASRDERRPTGLMARADAASGVAMKVLVIQNEVLEERIVRVSHVVAMTRPATVLVGDEEVRQPRR